MEYWKEYWVLDNARSSSLCRLIKPSKRLWHSLAVRSKQTEVSTFDKRVSVCVGRTANWINCQNCVLLKDNWDKGGGGGKKSIDIWPALTNKLSRHLPFFLKCFVIFSLNESITVTTKTLFDLAVVIFAMNMDKYMQVSRWEPLIKWAPKTGDFPKWLLSGAQC